ncbi:MAG TPA: ABC transporter substrate-binding protein [Pseudolysinimonas sp.]|nr:ABC transporter substrate-binding protein [Pseudolysinimonas sp.]
MSGHTRTLAAITAASLALGLALTGCGTGDDDSGGSSAVLHVWGGNATPLDNDFNPFHIDTAQKATFGPIYEPLFFYNQLSSEPPVPLIGESFEYSEDGMALTVTIKPDQKWSDGTALTADDVAFTFTYGTNKASDLISAEATDATTVVFTYTQPQFTAAPLTLGNTFIVPEHIWSGIDDYMGQLNSEPVGSGPYTLKTFSTAAYTIEANKNFREELPAVTEVQYVGLDGNQSSQDLLATGQLDWVGQFVANPEVLTDGGVLSTLNLQQDPTVVMTCSSAALGCSGPQTDVAVRQAISAALDRGTIREKAFAGLAAEGNPAFLLLPRDQSWLADDALSQSPQDPDVATAGEILEAAGYVKDADGFYGKNGEAIDLDLFSPDGWTDYNDAAKLISEQAAEAGIKITARTVSDAEYWTPLANGDFQLALYGLTASLQSDPYSTYQQYFYGASTAEVDSEPQNGGQNYARYSNPTVDVAVVAAGATADEAVKQRAYATIQAEIARDLPYIPVVLNASQSFFNSKDFTGWPSADDLYAMPLPYSSVASGIVLRHLAPAK